MIYSDNVVKCTVARRRSSAASRAIHEKTFIRCTAKVHPRIERNMALTDQTLVCRDCNQEFVFTVGEQEFRGSHNLTNSPTRCPSCRSARKAQAGGGYGNSRGGGPREARQLYVATCANCGGEAQVPFQPRGDKPVYCSNCYQTM